MNSAETFFLISSVSCHAMHVWVFLMTVPIFSDCSNHSVGPRVLHKEICMMYISMLVCCAGQLGCLLFVGDLSELEDKVSRQFPITCKELYIRDISSVVVLLRLPCPKAAMLLHHPSSRCCVVKLLGFKLEPQLNMLARLALLVNPNPHVCAGGVQEEKS